MPKRPVVQTIVSGFQSAISIASNFTSIANHFDNFLSRDGSSPNQMEADIDMNSNNINNVGGLSARGITLNGQPITPDSVTVDSPLVNLKDFGAVGDGVTDDSAAIWLALTTLFSSSEGALFIPAGIYRMESRVEISGLSSSGSYSIYGEGQASIIYGVNADGGIKIDTTSRHLYLNVSNLVFSPGLANSGTAFEYSTVEGGVSQRNVFRMENCIFESHDDTDLSSSWFNPLVVTGVNRPSFNNVVVWRDFTTPSDTLLDIDGCYKPIITDCYFNGAAEYGITNVLTNENEGFLLSNTTVNGPETGVFISQPGRHPEIWIVDNHINCTVRGIDIRNSKYIWIERNLIFSRDILAGASYTDIYLNGCDGINIKSNMFRGHGGLTLQRRHVELIDCLHVDVHEKRLHAATSIAPFYCDATCGHISLYLPKVPADYDFASYPADLLESLSEDNIFVITEDSVTERINNSLSGPSISLDKMSDSPANNDILGSVNFSGKNSVDENVTFARIKATSSDVTDGSERGSLVLSTNVNGSDEEAVTILNPSVNGEAALLLVVRESGLPVLRRVKVGANGTGPGGTGRALYVDNE
jgi:hypothetical protein